MVSLHEFSRLNKYQIMKKKLICGALIGLTLGFSSCKTSQDHIYLQNVDPGIAYAYSHPETRVHPGDKLSIVVSSKSPELAVPFNANGGASLVSINNRNGNVEPSTETRSTLYRVDIDGYIDFPLLGKIQVDGLTTNEVQDLIKNKIIDAKYINNPLVIAELQNFRYTVLGAVGSNGTKTAEDGHVNLLQAIANAGDLSSNANSRRVLVYREEHGKLKMYPHDLTDRQMFESPCFQLQQNDIVYVEPRHKTKDKKDQSFKIFSILLSAVGALSSVLWAYNSIKK